MKYLILVLVMAVSVAAADGSHSQFIRGWSDIAVWLNKKPVIKYSTLSVYHDSTRITVKVKAASVIDVCCDEVGAAVGDTTGITYFRRVFRVVDGKIRLVKTDTAKVIPAHHVPEQIVWPK